MVCPGWALSEPPWEPSASGGGIASGAIDGITDKQLSRAGDASAVAITKVVAARRLSDNEVGSVLAIIHLSFSRPSIVEDAADREPRTALFVLQYLDQSTSSTALKRQIASEVNYVLSQYKSLGGQTEKR